MRKGLLLILAVLLAGFAFTSCERDGPIIIRIANDRADGNPRTIGLNVFAEYVEEHSGGRIRVQVFNNSVLGGPNEYTESVIAGSIQAAAIGTELAQRAPIVAPWELPFMFPCWDAVQAVAESDFGRTMYDHFPETIGVRALGFQPMGFRVMIANRPLTNMDAFNGFRLRVPQIELYLTMGRNLGANTIAVAMSELYTAVQQGAVDGLELSAMDIVSGRFHENVSHGLVSHHIFVMHNLYINEAFFQSLPPDLQDVIISAGRHFQDFNFRYIREAENRFLDMLIADGVNMYVPSPEFRAQLTATQRATEVDFYRIYPGTEIVIAEMRRVMAESGFYSQAPGGETLLAVR